MTSHRKPFIIPVVSVGIALFIGVWFFVQRDNNSDIQNNTPQEISPTSPTPLAASAKPKHTPVALQLSKEVKDKIQENSTSETPFRFDVEYIFSTLSWVRVDSNGDLIVDASTLDLLNSAYSKLTSDISDNELAELQELIALGLPGPAGKEAAKIFGDYYHYRSAEKEFLESTTNADVNDIGSSFEQLVALRQAHLGYQVAEKIYGEEQRATLFTIKSMRIQEDTSLTEAEREQLQAALIEEMNNQPDSSTDRDITQSSEWLVRFQNFDQEKQYILDAGLSQRETEEQIEALLRQHFPPNEIDAARNFQSH